MVKLLHTFLLTAAATTMLQADPVTITRSTFCNLEGITSSGTSNCEVSSTLSGSSRASAEIRYSLDPVTGLSINSNADGLIDLINLQSPDRQFGNTSAEMDAIFRLRTEGPVRLGFAVYQAANGFIRGGGGSTDYASEFRFESLDHPLYLPPPTEVDLGNYYSCTVGNPDCQITLGKAFAIHLHDFATASAQNEPSANIAKQSFIQNLILYEQDGVTRVPLSLDDSPVPEPSTVGMLALPIAALAWREKKKRLKEWPLSKTSTKL